jgi:hypothetical protein
MQELRTALIIALAFVVALFGAGFTLTKVCNEQGCPQAHWSVHNGVLTSAAEPGQAA